MKYLLKLYVAGRSPKSLNALENLQRICRENLKDEYDIQMFDILKEPHLAIQDRILATPTLVKAEPPPPKRLIGDLSQKERVFQSLDLR